MVNIKSDKFKKIAAKIAAIIMLLTFMLLGFYLTNTYIKEIKSDFNSGKMIRCGTVPVSKKLGWIKQGNSVYKGNYIFKLHNCNTL